MKCFYEYKYKNGCLVGGHNLIDIYVKDNKIVLVCEDKINGYFCVTNYSLGMDVIDYLKITSVEEDKDGKL